MSTGSQVFTFRLPAALVRDIDEAIGRRNEVTREAPWTFSDFVRAAIGEKLRHMERARRPKKKGAK